jgi:hypothetical protein
MDNNDALRRQAEQAYARWRACESQVPRDAAGDEECKRLRNDYELADRAYRQARRTGRPSGDSPKP